MIPHWKQKFVLLWTGQALSILSSMVSQYALIWYLTDLTGSPAVLSLATMAAMVPQGVLSLFTGAFADRFDRRIIMMISDGAIGIISLALAALAFAGPLPVAPILVVAALRSVGGAFHSPCIQAVTPLIAPPESLTRCAGWSQGIQTVSMLLSPALASVLYAHVPLAWILLLDTLGAVFAIGGVLLARLPVLRAGEHGAPLRLWQDTREGLAVLRSHRWLWELTLICALFSVAFMPVSALFPLMSMDYFGGDSASAALVETLFSAGMLLGSVSLGLWGGTRDKILTMTAAVLGLGLTLVLSGLLPPQRLLGLRGAVRADGPVRPLLQLGVHGPDPDPGGAGVPGPGAGADGGHHDPGLPGGAGPHRPVRRGCRAHRVVPPLRRGHPGLRGAHAPPPRRAHLLPVVAGHPKTWYNGLPDPLYHVSV